MAAEKAKKTIVIGHKNPDTDSICSAIGYANFKTLQTGGEYVPCRAGELNPETTFVLDYFKVAVPKLIKSVKTQVKDIEIRETPGVSKNISLRKAWNLMQEDGLVTLPAVTDKNILEGLITVGDITRSYMNVYDSSILSKACTQYANIIETLEGAIFVGDEKEYFDKGKVLIAAANPDMMEYYIEENDLVILGNRYESQLCAIEMGASCIIVCEGAGVSMTIKKLAQERGCTVITTPYDTYTAARLINQSMPISYFMPHPVIFLERKNSWLLQYQLSVFLCCFAPQHIRHTGSYGAAKIRHIIPGDAYFLCITFEHAGYNLHVFYTGRAAGTQRDAGL